MIDLYQRRKTEFKCYHWNLKMHHLNYLNLKVITLRCNKIQCCMFQKLYKSRLKNLWAEKCIWWHHMCCFDLFWPMRSKHFNTDGRTVWAARGTMLKNIPHLVIFHESILVSLSFSAEPQRLSIIYIYSSVILIR